MLFTLGALRPFIASENGLAFGLTSSNAVMVGSFRSMSGAVTNICADFSTPQHVRIMPQTANTGEFDIGDPAQATGRYLMFSKPAGTFLLGHDGTDAFRVNVANGYVTMPGGALFGDGTGGIFEVNANAQFEIDPLGQMLLNGDDTVASHRSEIFLHGTNAHIRLDLGAPIEDWTAVTHLTMAPGSASLDGQLKISAASGSGQIAMTSSNGIGLMVLKPAHNLPAVITNEFNFTNAAAGQILTVISSNNNKIVWGVSNAPTGSQTPWASDINAAGFSLSNTFKLSLGTNGYSGTQNPSFILGGTNSAGTGVMMKVANTNSALEFRGGTGTTYSASTALTLGVNGQAVFGGAVNIGGNCGVPANSTFNWSARSSLASDFNGEMVMGTALFNDFYSLFFGNNGATNGLLRFVSSTTLNPQFEFRNGTTNNDAAGWANVKMGSAFLSGTNTIGAPGLQGPLMGCQLYSDGTNLVGVFQNAAGTRTTNKFTMSAWP